jgi:hypothetical protein
MRLLAMSLMSRRNFHRHSQMRVRYLLCYKVSLQVGHLRLLVSSN